MGVQIVELLKRHEIEIDQLANRIIAIDAPNHLYQFLTTIRSPDGMPFTDSKGNVTSHLIGLFSRSTNLMQKGIKLAYVFDGQTPLLKHKELEKRKLIKAEAERQYVKALGENDAAAAKKYAGRFSRLNEPMIEEAKKLLLTLGIPYVQAPSEGEAQAAYMVKKGAAHAISSQDADSLVFGATRLIRNLSITGKRKLPGKQGYVNVNPEEIVLQENLKEMGINQDQLTALCMLVGTDYNPGGIKGIGPKKALALIKKHGADLNAAFEEAEWEKNSELPWETIFELFKQMPVTDNFELQWKRPDKEKTMELLCSNHDFSEERVSKTMDSLIGMPKGQRGLGDFT